MSAVVNSRFGMNYSCLLNEYRIKDALHLLVDKRYMDKNVEAVSYTHLYPTKYVIDPEGKIAKQVVGENPEFYMYLDALMI